MRACSAIRKQLCWLKTEQADRVSNYLARVPCLLPILRAFLGLALLVRLDFSLLSLEVVRGARELLSDAQTSRAARSIALSARERGTKFCAAID